MIKDLEKRRREALKLKREMDEITEQHINFVNIAEAEEKRRRNMGQARAKEEMFKKRNARLETLEDNAYERYYNHMHKEFDVENSSIHYTSSKYKDKFCDTKYINDMYDLKKKQLKVDKAQAKALKKEKRANARETRVKRANKGTSKRK